jgi:membrane dipeptidase
MASHNACRSLVPGDRQFSDEQIKQVIQRNGIIGAPFDSWMLVPDFVIGTTLGSAAPLSAVADHIDHICQLAGNARHVAIGSDLDGGFGTEQSPDGLNTIADLQKLDGILASRGYRNEDIDAIFSQNWAGFFAANLPVS